MPLRVLLKLCEVFEVTPGQLLDEDFKKEMGMKGISISGGTFNNSNVVNGTFNDNRDSNNIVKLKDEIDRLRKSNMREDFYSNLSRDYKLELSKKDKLIERLSETIARQNNTIDKLLSK